MTSLALSILPNPCHSLGSAVLPNCQSGTGPACSFTAAQLSMFNTIKTSYSDPMANENYHKIPCDVVMYMNLLDALQKTKRDTCYSSNSDVMLLFGIVEDALKGAVNAFQLNIDVVRLSIDNNYLHEVIHEYMSGDNIRKMPFNAEGSYSLLKGFEMSPLFKNYICIYGLPSPGQGFDLGLLKIVYDSMISGGLDPGVDNFQCIPAISECAANKIMVSLYSRLSILMDSFKFLNQMYYSGQVALLQGIYTQTVYEALYLQLEEISLASQTKGLSSTNARPLEARSSTNARQLEARSSKKPTDLQKAYAEYENLRTYLSVSLGSLNVAVRHYDALMKAEEKIASDAEKLAILLDPVKLKAYAQEFLLKSRTLLPAQQIQIISAKLKPHYAKYVELYGFPEGGAFDPDKLAAIKNELGIA